nr:dihydroxyacetone kinase subunit DhaL [uncultured Cohaesibacter sp.]
MKQVEIDDIVAFLREAATRMKEAADYLGQLDGEIGDGDHGYTMSRGFSAIVRALNEIDVQSHDMSTLFRSCAESFLEAVGATPGPLYASGLIAAGDFAGNRSALDADEALMILVAISDGIGARGKAIAGDKTMMDVWLPVVQTIKTLRHENAPLEVILSEIRISASRGVESTRSMVAMRGRAARLGGRSLGHIDPGAASAAILIESFANTLEQRAL